MGVLGTKYFWEFNNICTLYIITYLWGIDEDAFIQLALWQIWLLR
jgi:hypothetical protein